MLSFYGTQFYEKRIQFVTIEVTETFAGYPAVQTKGIDFAPVCRVNIKQLHLMED
ncbi:hypothetical protein [Muribaculum intestinale]|uniref:hypothetical protein n=1 Tax=Muribaculum intestinale TaxID=1796646 RepID=UPI0027299035|nr:hypothetical protein [Muribaculum intestinale]